MKTLKESGEVFQTCLDTLEKLRTTFTERHFAVFCNFFLSNGYAVGESFCGGLVLRSQEASGGVIWWSQEASGGLVLRSQEALATGTYVARGLRRSCFTVARGSYTIILYKSLLRPLNYSSGGLLRYKCRSQEPLAPVKQLLRRPLATFWMI